MIRFAAGAAQQQKVEPGAEARLFQQAERALSGALLEALLHQPDFLHHRIMAMRDSELRLLPGQHLIHRLVHRAHRAPALLHADIPCRQHLMPQQCGKQKRRRDRLFLAETFVGVAQRQHDEFLAHRLF